MDIPALTAADGVCGSELQVISLAFHDTWNLTFTFAKNHTSYFMSSASLSYRLQHGHQPFPDAKDLTGDSGTFSPQFYGFIVHIYFFQLVFTKLIKNDPKCRKSLWLNDFGLIGSDINITMFNK